MKTNYWKLIICLLSVVAVMTACKDKNAPEARKAFVGEYTFVSEGEIDLYAGAAKVYTVPMNEEGEMSITLGDEPNTLWVVAAGDSARAYVSGNNLFIDPTYETAVFGDLTMELSFTYGKATLQGNELSCTTDVEITATYISYSLFGNGKVDILATKKK